MKGQRRADPKERKDSEKGKGDGWMGHNNDTLCVPHYSQEKLK